jgi:hypothetical protein
MMTPKELGKWAKTVGINAPTLDAGLACWIKNSTQEERKQYYVEWWEGWYEALDEIISFQQQQVNYENRSAA